MSNIFKPGKRILICLMLVVTVVASVFFYYANAYVDYNSLHFRGKLVNSTLGVRMYDMPGDESDIGMLTGGATVGIAGEYENFYYIRTRTGDVGWIEKAMVKNVLDMREIEKARQNMLKAIEEGKGKFQ